MKVAKRYLVGGSLIAAGAFALLTSHSRIDGGTRSSQFSKTVSFAEKLSDKERADVNAKLKTAMGTTSASNSANLLANPALVKEIKDRASLARFHDLEFCLDSRNPCEIPQTEPRSSDIWVSDRAVRELQGLRLAFSQLSPEEQGSVREELAAATEWALAYDDDAVREEGMHLSRLSLAPEPRIRAVIASLKESVSAPLYDVGLSILRENKEVATQDQVNFYVETIQTGGFYASEEVARQILPYLNDDNINRFIELRNQLPAESNAAAYLNECIKEYRMIAQGG